MTKNDDVVARHFARMFSADRADPEFFSKFPAYAFDAEVGARPWWPPLSEVWQRQGQVVDYDRGKERHWREAWDLLQALRAEYEAARKRVRGRVSIRGE